MADAYLHPLLLRFQVNSNSRLKVKLVKHFQSKRNSGGGECEVEHESGSGTAVVRFKSEEDRRNVLAKETHHIDLGAGIRLAVTVGLLPGDQKPLEVPSDDRSKKSHPQIEAQEPISTSAVIGNISEKVNDEFLRMLVENVLKELNPPTATFTLEAIPGIASAVVTFQKKTEIDEFMMRCPLNKTFKSVNLTVRPLGITNQVAVEDGHRLGQDLLSLHFDNEGCEVENVEFNEEEQAYIFTFKDSKAVQNIMKQQHLIGDKELRVFPFYKSLGTSLYGKDKPSPKLPPAFSETVDDAVLKYLKDTPQAEEAVRHELAKHFCSVNLDQSSVRLTPMSSLLQQKGAKVLVTEWRAAVKSAFAQAVSKYKSVKFQPELEVWKECEESIRQELRDQKGVALVADEARGLLAVVGPDDDINSLEQNLCEVVKKIDKKLQRERCSDSQVMRVSPSTFHLLSHDGLQENLLRVLPELRMSFCKVNSHLTITGLNKEIMQAHTYICDARLKLKPSNLEMDEHILGLLKLDEQEELTDVLLTSRGINAAFEISDQRVQLLASSDKCLKEAIDHLQSLLRSEVIDVEDSTILEMPEWRHLVDKVQEGNSWPCRRLLIQTIDQHVVVCGLREVVENVCHELEDFLMQNTRVRETVVAQANTVVEYLKKFHWHTVDECKNSVAVSFNKKEICLSGGMAHVSKCRALVENLLSSVVFERFTVSKLGLRKFFKDKESMYLYSLLNETGCMVRLVDETVDEPDQAASSLHFRAQMPDGVKIAVSKSDLCSYPVDAVVNSCGPDLKHSEGLALALAKAAGPKLQIECDKIVSLRGQIQYGDCVMTGAGGNLCCKKVIHAVGPMFNSATPKKDTAQLKKVVKGSLELAEKSGCLSVALPAISRSRGFSLDLCVPTIVQAIREHCAEGFGENTLKEIHLVDIDDVVVNAMEIAVDLMFDTKVDHSQNPKLKKKVHLRPPIKLHPRRPTAQNTDQNCLGQVNTKEGLTVLLTKGNIQDATTEVMVNIVSVELALTKGVVSNAVLGVAGPQLQLEVNAKKASASVGDIIVTGGCKLKSKAVFHAVPPSWNLGQGKSEETLGVIFKECLKKAEEKGLSSISFPAIGTGNLGFPRSRVASMLFKEISAFSSSRPALSPSVKKVVIVLFPKDTQTIKVFGDVFKEMFPSPSDRTAAAISPPRPGPFSKIASSSGMYETQMGNVAVQLVTGDIIAETTDVIVNSSNQQFTLKSGVSKAILEAAGKAVEEECQELGAQPNTGMIMTQPGNLKCKKIIHLAGRTEPAKITQVVKDALQMCVKDSHTSVSFPAIGTGHGQVQARQVADAMFEAVVDVLSQSPSGPLRNVRIVVFQTSMVAEFYDSMLQLEKKQDAPQEPEEKETSWLLGKYNSIKSFFSGSSPVKSQEVGDFIIKALEPSDPVCFHICGDGQVQVDSAKRWLSHLIDQDRSSKTISDQAILKFTDDDFRRLVDIQESLGVAITTECKDGTASMVIEGYSNALEACCTVNEMLKKVREDEDLRLMMELAETAADWQHQEGPGFRSFDSAANLKLEQALEKKQASVEVTVHGRQYTVAMPKGPATDAQGGTLQIKRVDKLTVEELPPHWDDMPANTSCHTVVLTAGTPEYTEVLNLFQATCKNRNVIKIERIQNPVLWKSLQIKKRGMDQRNGHQNNERRLFHGTCQNKLAIINSQGFNRSYAGMNAACYGNGTYFALNANYSANDQYSKPSASGEKCMYLCRVLTGDFTQGKQNMIVPPIKPGAAVQNYDSVVDRVASPTIFVVFHDTQACPEYLITFT